MAIPYGYQPLKEQVNEDDIRFKNPIGYVYFNFKVGDNGRTIVTLRNNQIIYGFITVNVSEAFAADNFLHIGTLANVTLITRIALEFTGPVSVFGGVDSADILTRTTQSLDIRYSLKGTSTVGRGWGVLQYLDLNLVEGFR